MRAKRREYVAWKNRSNSVLCQGSHGASRSEAYELTMVCVACVQGLYREEFVRVTERAAIACLSCPVGWQTKAKGATSKRECTSKWQTM
jgi:hypothetical protein